MSEPRAHLDFDAEVLPHLDAAYNLARWLTRNKQDAEDVIQEAFLRSFQFFDGFRGGNARAWLLRIVRNTCYTLLQRKRAQPGIEFDETAFVPNRFPANPEEALLGNDTFKKIRLALEALPPGFREVLILRELEGMSYKEISEVLAIPPGTVMSRLSRARAELRQSLAHFAQEDPLSETMGRSDQINACGEQNAQ